MNIRLMTEEMEERNLSKYATLSKNTKGRVHLEEKCDLRTDFQRDRDRILHSKAFRRLKHKTQVFIAPEGDHYRTRLTHTLEVSQISRTLARALRLNEDLTEAISIGHDLGHTPFGHTGEEVLDSLHRSGFKHNHQSIRVVELLENRKSKKGLNLTHEVKNGILNHTGPGIPETLEGQVVKISDRIAYINHDIDDSLRSGILSEKDLPNNCLDVLGRSHGERINNMILDIIKASYDQDKISIGEEMKYHMDKLRDFMFENVYLSSRAKKEGEKAKYILNQLYEYYIKNFDKIPEERRNIYKEDNSPVEDIVCDYIAGMTDRYAISIFSSLFMPRSWEKI